MFFFWRKSWSGVGHARAQSLLASVTYGEAGPWKTASLHFDVTDVETGKPVGDLEPYLGAMAHFMVLSADGQDFVHVHAPKAPGGHAHHQH